MNCKNTGDKIYTYRKRKGWTQKELAKQLHVSISAISKWERGLNYPDLDLLEPMASLLQCSVMDLLCLENKNKDEVFTEISKFSIDSFNSKKKDYINKSILILVSLLILLVFTFYIVTNQFYNGLIYAVFKKAGVGIFNTI